MWFDMVNNTIAGNLTFENTNSNYYDITGPPPAVPGWPKNITVNGNFNVSGSTSWAAITGCGSYLNDAVTPTVSQRVGLIVKGNINITSNGIFLFREGSKVDTDRVELWGNLNLDLGGTTFASHSYSTPTSLDSVFFVGTGTQKYLAGNLSNGNSLCYVISTGATVDMDTSHFQGSKGTFYIASGSTVECSHASGLNGNIAVGKTKTLSTAANYEFYGSTASVTGSLLPSTVNTLTISNTAGDTLSSAVTVTDSATISSGANVVESSGKYIIGKAVTSQTVATGTNSNIGGLGVGTSGSDNLGTVSITRTSGTAGVISIGGKSGINRNWVITSTNPPTNGTNLTLSWDALDNNSKDLTTAQVYKSTDGGSSWLAFGSPQNASGTQSVTVNTTSFSSWTVSDGANPLPVELSSFSSSVNSLGVNLQWKTATEINNYGFEIQRAVVNDSVASQFSKIGFIKGSGTSNSTKSYSFMDNSALYGKFQYRLKQIDNNGSFKYSQVIDVDLSNKPLTFTMQNFPNPFNPTTIINYSIPQASFVTLTIYNILGEKVATLVNQKQVKGIYNVNFNAGRLASGMYIYVLSTEKNSISKKMMLLK